MKTPARTNQNTVASYRAFVAQQSADNARLHVRALRAMGCALAVAPVLYFATMSAPELARQCAGAVAGSLVCIPLGIALATLSDYRAARAARRK